MKTELLVGLDKEITEWVEGQLQLGSMSPSTAIGVKQGNRLIAGVVYNNFHTSVHGEPLSIEMSIAAVDKSWCTRHNLNTFFAYPFIQLGLKRVQSTCSASNPRTRAFLERLGFKPEGIMRQSWPHGGDGACYSMLKHECRWLEYGQKLS